MDSLTPKILDDNAAFLGRPKTARNPAFGIQRFVPLVEMKEGGRYFKDDTIYLAVDVDLSDIPRF